MMTPSTNGEDKVTEEMDFMPLITFMQKHGGMCFEDVLLHPLVRLNAIHEGLLKHVAEESSLAIGNSLLGGIGGIGTGAAQTTNNAAPKSDIEVAIETGDRDAYFAVVNQSIG